MQSDEIKSVLSQVNETHNGYGEPSAMTKFLVAEGYIDLVYAGNLWSAKLTKAGTKFVKSR